MNGITYSPKEVLTRNTGWWETKRRYFEKGTVSLFLYNNYDFNK